MNIIETNAEKTERGLIFTTKEHYFITEFQVDTDGYYDISVGYAHDDWEAYISFGVTYPDGGTCWFMQGLLHGQNQMTVPLYLKNGTNNVKIKQISRYTTEIFQLENCGLSKNLCYEISPKNNILFEDDKKEFKTFVKTYRDRLIKTEADGEISINSEYVPRDEKDGHEGARADIYPDSDAVYGLGEGKHTLTYTFESGKVLTQNIEIRKRAPKVDLQIINLDVCQANAVLIHLPNGKNMLIDSATTAMAEERVIPYLTKNNIKLDYYLLTHFHNDHQGMKEEILEMNSLLKPDSEICEKLVKKDKNERYEYLKNFGYMDSSMLCYYDEIHRVWDLGGVTIEVTNSRYDENGTPVKPYYYSYIKNNEHNFENSTSVSFMLKYKDFGYYHSADAYGYSQDRYMADMIKQGREDELFCHWFYANHHFINDINAKFINSLNPVGVYVPNDKLYHRAAYTHYYKSNVENYYFSHKKLKDTIVSSEAGSARICVNSSDDWYYEVLDLK